MMQYEAIIRQLSLEQKAALLSGKNTWETYDIAGLVPSMFLADGPHGVRKQLGASDHLGLNESVPATCFPTAATLANSWDESLIQQVGHALGQEALALDVQVVLGPGLNTKRNPRCGRNFEYYSEDPYLSGKLAAAMIRGIQSSTTIACPKHFAVNSQEYRRMASDSIVDERTLHEIYLTNFEIAVKEGKPKALMSSYNLINGTYANENAELLQKTLRDDWQFDGFVVSDWGGDNDHVSGVASGSHLAMPSLGREGIDELVTAVKQGRLAESVLDQRVDELLRVIFASSAVKEGATKETIDWQAHHQIARQAAQESIVLLKNDKQVLPLAAKTKVAIIGDFAKQPRYQGAGSSAVNTKQLETTTEILQQFDLEVIGFAQGYQRNGQQDEQLIQQACQLASQAEVAIVYAGLPEIFESEGLDRNNLKMPANQCQLIERLSQTTAKVVVVLSAGSSIEIPWFDQVEGILHGYLAGQAGASAMLSVITGQVNPSGKLNETYPLSAEQVPFNAQFPSKKRYSYYMEGPFVGYRYYDTVKSSVRFPFGFGLSYTQFAYENLTVADDGIRFTLRNIGDTAGAEIVQLYIGKKDSSLLRPAKELKGFKKVYLHPGQAQTVFIPFDEYSFRVFDATSHSWQVEAGDYQVYLGASVDDIRLSQTIQRVGSRLTTDLPAESIYHTLAFKQAHLADFEQLYGQKVPTDETKARVVLQATDIIADLQYAKSPLARLVFRILQKKLQQAEQKGKPDLNLLFIYNMPFRAIYKMTNGQCNQAMVEQILRMVNGQFFVGLTGLIKAWNQNRQLQKKA